MSNVLCVARCNEIKILKCSLYYCSFDVMDCELYVSSCFQQTMMITVPDTTEIRKTAAKLFKLPSLSPPFQIPNAQQNIFVFPKSKKDHANVLPLSPMTPVTPQR